MALVCCTSDEGHNYGVTGSLAVVFGSDGFSLPNHSITEDSEECDIADIIAYCRRFIR